MALLANNKWRMVRMSQGDPRDTFHLSRLTRNDLRMQVDFFSILLEGFTVDATRSEGRHHRTIASSFFESQAGEPARDQRSEPVRETDQEMERITSISTGAPRGNSAAPTATRA